MTRWNLTLNFKILEQAVNKDSVPNYLNCVSRHCFSYSFPQNLESQKNITIHAKLLLNQRSKTMWTKIKSRPKDFTQNFANEQFPKDSISWPSFDSLLGVNSGRWNRICCEPMSHLSQQKRCFLTLHHRLDMNIKPSQKTSNLISHWRPQPHYLSSKSTNRRNLTSLSLGK